MARHYHLEIAAFVADADPKWVDNLLSRFDVPGVEAAKQGIARRISISGIQHIALVRRLTIDLSIAADLAVALARKFLATDADRLQLSAMLSLDLDLARFRREIDQRLAQAVESILPPRRGRPPARSPE